MVMEASLDGIGRIRWARADRVGMVVYGWLVIIRVDRMDRCVLGWIGRTKVG